MNRKELAAALGISGAMVTKLAKRGMPVDDVDKAIRWRRRHLEPTRTKGIRMDASPGARRTPHVAAPPLAPARASASSAWAAAGAPRSLRMPVAKLGDFDWQGPDLELRIVNRLAALAVDDFETHAEELRLFMCMVPRAERGRVVMSFALWDRLYPPGFLALVAPDYQPGSLPADLPTGAGSVDGGVMSPEDHVLYEVACGLRQFRA